MTPARLFPLDSFRLARTLTCTAGVLAGSSVACAAVGGPLATVATSTVLAALLAYGARYEARNVRANRRAARVRRNLQANADHTQAMQDAANVTRMLDFAAREHGAVYGEALS